MGTGSFQAVAGLLLVLVSGVIMPTLGAEDEGATEDLAAVSVATVNGEPLSARLLQRRLIRNRSLAYRHFRDKYGTEESADFWTTAYEGVTPLDWLKEVTLEGCVRIKVEQIVAREQGVISDISYRAFLGALDRENERRRRALAAGQPIYGPKQYREDEYFIYVFTNMVIRSKRRLWDTKLQASDETLRSYYERVKERLYQRGDRVRIWAIAVPFGGHGAESLSRAEAEARIREVERKLGQGVPFEELARAYSESGYLDERVLDDESARFDERTQPALREQSMKLPEGETSGVFEERSAFHIVRCVERQPLGYMPFDGVRSNVRSRYVDEKYEQLIDDLVGQAEVEVSRPVYEALRVR